MALGFKPLTARPCPAGGTPGGSHDEPFLSRPGGTGASTDAHSTCRRHNADSMGAGSNTAFRGLECAPPSIGHALPNGRGWRLARNALYVDRQLPFDDWVSLGHRITIVSDSAAWWIGDWLHFGRIRYGRRRYTAVLEATDLDYQTLRNYAWVAARIPPSRRRQSLSFGHHAEVAALSEADQDRWLSRCALEHWPRSELRRRRRIHRRNDEDLSRASSLALIVEAGRRLRWESAATATGRPLEGWIAEVLDTAAATVLGPEPDASAT
jgi:hypothetical protein